MKMRCSGTIAAMSILLLVAMGLAGDKPWFDMEICSFCKCLTEDPHLLENMSWEYHDISNGVISITTVNPEFRESYLKAQKAMEKVAHDMASGNTQVQTCGHCAYYGKLMMNGARIEVVEAKPGWIILITSEKPEVIEMIHEFGQRNRDEMAKLEKQEK